MKDKIYLTIIFDYYETLLNEKDKKCFKDYYFDNLSLSEIAENSNLSRNAIHKRLKRVEDKLQNYEKRLKLYEKEIKILNLLSDEKSKNEVKRILNS